MPPKKKPQPTKKPSISNTNNPHFAGCFGKSGSGKSHAMWRKFQEWQRLERQQVMVWSPKEVVDNYAGKLRCRAYTNMAELIGAVAEGRDVVYVPSLRRDEDEKLFDIFCQVAFRLASSGKPVTLMVDELQTVTRSGWAPPWWLQVSTVGRGIGLRALASSQRPALIDKTYFGALSYAWCGRQNFKADAKVTAELVLRTPEEIIAIPLKQGFERHM